LGLATPEDIRTARKRRGLTIRESVIRHLTEVRSQKRISIRKLSELSGLSRATIRNIESGQQSPSLETLIQLTDGLEVDLPGVIRDMASVHPKTD